MASDDIATLGLEVDSKGIVNATRQLDKLESQAGQTERATDKLGKQSMTSSKDVNKLGNEAKTAGAHAHGAGNSMAFMALQMAAMAGAVAAVVGTFSAIREFGASLSNLSAITGATGKDLEFYKEQSRLIGETTTLSATQAVNAFKLIASAKPDLLQSKEALAAVTREAVTLAEAASIDMPAAATALTGALNQFGEGASQASRFINILAAGAKFGASTIEQTTLALRDSGTVAAAAGLSFEETNAAIQALAITEIKGARAGTNLRNILIILQTQANDNLNPAIVGLSAAMINLRDANLSTTEMTKLFGRENITAAQGLMVNADAIGSLTGKLTGTSVAMQQARTNVDNLDGDVKELGSKWESVALTLGDSFNPAIRATTQFIGDISKPVKQLIIEFADLGDALGSYAAIAGAVLSLDFDAVTAIVAARKEERVEVDKKIESIWAEKRATDALNDSKLTGTTITPDGSETATPKGTTISAAAPSASQIEQSFEQTRMSLLNEEQLLFESYERRRDTISAALATGLIVDAESDDFKLQLKRQFEDEKTAIAAKGEADRRALLAAEIGAAGNLLGSMAALMKTEGKKQSAIQKNLARASIIASTASAIMKAADTMPFFPLGLLMAGTAAAMGAKQLQAVGAGGSAPSVGSLTSPAGFQRDSLASNISPRQAPQSTQSTFILIGNDQFDESQLDVIMDRMSERLNEGSQIIIRRDSPQAQEIALAVEQ